MRFNFCGELKFSEGKRPYLREGRGKNGKAWKSLNIGVASDVNNRGFVEIFGQDRDGDDIHTKGINGEDVTIAWKNRDTEETLSSVANYRKYVIALDGEERMEFIDSWDAVNYILEHVDEIKNKRYVVTGDVTVDEYNGRITRRFTLRNIYPVREDNKNGLVLTGEIYFTADGIDLADWKDEKKININAYTKEWMSKDNPNAYVPQSFVFDCSKVNFENEKHVGIMKLRAKQFGVEFSDKMQPKVFLKKTKIYAHSAVIKYVNGAETIEFGYDQLTPSQKEYVDWGLRSVEDFRPRGQAFGDRVVIYKITDFDLNGQYVDGLLQTEIMMKEFEEDIYRPAVKEDAESILSGMNPPEEEKENEKPVDDDEESIGDLFG